MLRAAALVAVGQTTHAAHHAQHVVVQRIHADLRSASAHNRVDGDRQLEGRLVNAREVARAARLVLLGAQGEGVHVDTRRRAAAVVLEGLHLVEVGALTLSETVLSVELQLGNLHGVLALAAGSGVEDDLREQVVNTRLELVQALEIASLGTDQRRVLRHALSEEGSGVRGVGAQVRGLRRRRVLREQRHDQTLRAEVVRVVEGLGATDGGNPGLVRAVHERVALDNPQELLDGVVKIQLDLVGRRRDGLGTRVLHLLNQVLVRVLGKAAALLRVEVHVVDIQRGGSERLGSRGGRGAEARLVVDRVLPRLEVHVNAHLVVLQRNQGDRQTRVAAEPELQRDVKRLGGGTLASHARDGRLRRRARSIKRKTAGALQQH